MNKTINDIQKIKDDTLKSFGNRIGQDDSRIYIMTCCGTGCTSSGALKNREKLDELMERDGLQDKVHVIKTGCFGLCAEGPILMVYPENVMYTNVTPDDINELSLIHISSENKKKSKSMADFVFEAAFLPASLLEK